MNKLKKTFRTRCKTCPRMMPLNSKQWSKYCGRCKSKRFKDGQQLGAAIKRVKKELKITHIINMLKAGKRLSIKDIMKITGYKRDTVVVMLNKAPEKVKGVYVYYL